MRRSRVPWSSAVVSLMPVLLDDPGEHAPILLERQGERCQFALREKCAGSVCACEQIPGPSMRYVCCEEHHHECKPQGDRHTSASASAEKTGQAAGANRGRTSVRTPCARSKGAANVFTLPCDQG